MGRSIQKSARISPEKIWVVMPGFNEGKYLDAVLKKLVTIHAQVVFVDDGSKDQTTRIAQKYVPHVLQHRVNLGKGAAMKTGAEYAFEHLDAEAVIFMDSDGQHDPSELSLFFTEFAQGAQVVFGERKMGSEMPLIRIIGNRFASFLIYLLFGMYVPDIPSGFKALAKSAYKAISWQSTGYEVELEIAAKVAKNKLPFSTVQIQTIYHDMDRGMTPMTAIRMVWKAISWKVSL